MPSTCRSLLLIAALLALVLCGLTMPLGARAAEAPLLVLSPDSVLWPSPKAQVVFKRSSGWKKRAPKPGQAPTTGQYEQRAGLGKGATCVLTLDVLGAAVEKTPQVQGGKLTIEFPVNWTAKEGLKVVQQSRPGSAWPWYRVAEWHSHSAAFALVPTPDFVGTTRPIVVIGSFIGHSISGATATTRPSAKQRRACDRRYRKASKTTLVRVISSAQVARR